MKNIGFFVAVLEPLKPTVRKTLMSDSVHVVSTDGRQPAISRFYYNYSSNKSFTNVLPEKL